jgi:hypothetical protein
VVGGVRVWDHVKDRVAGYLAEYGRPEQVAAWRDGRPYVAELADNSAGRLAGGKAGVAAMPRFIGSSGRKGRGR